jgi:transcriptional regulator with GAF, ATPase, and Fis domain
MDSTSELGAPSSRFASSGEPIPGIALVFSGNQPYMAVAVLGRRPLELGRQEGLAIPLKDSSVSRLHAHVVYGDGRFTVTDLGSKNGSFVDGVRFEGSVTGAALRLLRIGASVFLLLHDVRPYLGTSVAIEQGSVIGPILREAVTRTEHIARAGRDLHLTGETGVGKEVFARIYHAATEHATGPFVAVNCATIPRELAESILFGARRGAFTGAHAEQAGLFRSADGGTLFLDEAGELDLALQAKLLRVLELREVTPVGSSHAHSVDVRVCSATLRDLRDLVRRGRFREDLYFRLARPSVAIPALRQRPEEIPWLMQRAADRVSSSLELSSVMVEACLLRAWPGNVRELMAAMREASHAAVEAGSAMLKLSHLDAEAGLSFEEPQGTRTTSAPASHAAPVALPASPAGNAPEERRKVEELLRRTAGNVSRTARLLGWHRTQLRRFMEREGLDPRTYSQVDGDSLKEEE